MPKSLSAIKLALAARQLRSQTSDADLLAGEPIAIIGIGCRLPGGGDSPEGYWRLLENGVDAISEVPKDRWDIDELYDPDPSVPGRMSTKWGAFLGKVDGFDPKFFGIAPREAASMDPQQRLVLEVAWEALEDAGLTHTMLAGSATGVFMAVYNNDYALWQVLDKSRIDAYTGLGTAHSIASGRLSFLLDLQGPSLVVDTACSSSLVAVHLACQSLRTGESRVALAGGVSLVLSPETAIGLSKWGFMASDGRCKTFDARADGFVRGEGCGVVVLKRLSEALADNDRVLAVIRGSAVNQDGRSTVLTSPSGPSQEAVLRRALTMGRVDPSEITYVEAHGTGTSLGDPIEVEAIAEVLGRPADGPRCLIGSVKTNIGHLEAAAGVAGLIKVVLALQHERIPPHLHFQSLNPHISLDGTRLAIVPAGAAWPSAAGRRFAGVSSFGFGGTNAHVVVEEAPQLPASQITSRADRPRLLPLSAASPDALRALAASYAEFLRSSRAPRIDDVCHTAALRRTHHTYRLTVAGRNSNDIADALAAHGAGDRRWQISIGQSRAARRHSPVFVFCGQGPQWWGMARGLFEDAVFRQTVEQCAAIIDPIAGFSIVDELRADESGSRLRDTVVAQPALFVLQMAVTAMWRARGVVPSAVVGHSVGEIAAACVAGALNLDDAARIVVHRARLMQRLTGAGKMVSIRASVSDLRDTIERHRDRVSVGASNAPAMTVLSGDPATIDQIIAESEAANLSCRLLPVNYAFHSYQLAPLAGELRQAFADVRPQKAAVPMISTVTGLPLRDLECNAAYWVHNVTDRVRFADAIRGLARNERDIFIEIGPQPVMASAISECLAAENIGGTVVASLHQGRDDEVSMLAAVGHVFSAGATVDWTSIQEAGARPVSLPAYPWQRERYWNGPPAVSPASTLAAHRGVAVHPLLGAELSSPALSGIVFETELSASSPAFVADHRIHDTVLFPATGFIAAALVGAERGLGSTAVEIRDLIIKEALTLDEEPRRVQTIFDDAREGVSGFRLVSRTAAGDWTTHVVGQLVPGEKRPDGIVWTPPPSEALRVTAADHYNRMRGRGCQFGPMFQGVVQLQHIDADVWAEIAVPELANEAANYAVHPALLDACFQPLATAVERVDPSGSTWVPFAIGRLRLFSHAGTTLHARARLTHAQAERGVISAVVDVFDEHYQLVMSIEDLGLGRVTPAALHGSTREWFYTVDWEAVPPRTPQGDTHSGRWILFADRSGLASRLAEHLRATGDRCSLVYSGNVRPGSSDDAAIADPLDSTAYEQVVSWASSLPGPSIRGFVHMWGTDVPAPDRLAATALVDVEREGCGSVTALAQALMRVRGAAPLWVVTQGAQRGPSEDHVPSATQAALWGLVRTIALEHPEMHCVTVDLERDTQSSIEVLVQELRGGAAEPEMLIRQGVRYVPRLSRDTTSETASRSAMYTRLEPQPRGVLDNLTVVPAAQRQPVEGEVEILVRATGLNFRDVLNALGMYPGEAGPLGDECAGTVTRVGPGVTDLKPGDEVVGIAHGSFASHAVAAANLLVKRAPTLTPVEAVTAPITFLTAEYSLHHVAKIKQGDRVLVHAAAGGVGLAAIQIAREAGAEIFATAGGPEKHAFLRSLGIEHIFSSRTPDFADEIRRRTDGHGVDIVLNSLTGDFIPRSLDVLASGGRFVEIGRTGIWDPEQVRHVRPDVDYAIVFMGDVFRDQPAISRAMLVDIFARLERGALKPLPVREFGMDEAVAAFRYVAQARHIGKVVVTQQPAAGQPVSIRPSSTYVITGGLGALGLHVARWLVSRGARSLVLAGRRAPDAAAQAAVQALERDGATVRLAQVDLAHADAGDRLHAALANLPPLGGVVHAAGVVDDAMLQQQDWGQFVRVFGPKAVGAHTVGSFATGAGAEFVVLFSSGASVLGSRGQANYAAANAFLDAYVWELKTRGLRAWSINWGAWAGEGMTAALSDRDRNRTRSHGHHFIEPDEGLAALERVLTRDAYPQIAILPIDWPRFLEQEPAGQVRPIVSRFSRRTSRTESTSTPSPAILADRMAAASPSQRREMLSAHIRETALTVLGLPAAYALDAHQGLRDVGLDSLMAVELKNRLQASTGQTLPATLAFDYPTVAALTKFLGPLLRIDDKERETSGETDEGRVVAELAELSDEEAEALLAEELAALDKGTAHGH